MTQNPKHGPMPLRESDLSHATGGIVCGGPLTQASGYLLTVIKATMATVLKEADTTTPKP